MRTPTRVGVTLAALGLALAIPVAATARPTSTHILTASVTEGSDAFSIVVEVADDGSTTVDFGVLNYELVPCVGGLAARTTLRNDTGVASTTAFAVDRKLTEVSWSGTVDVESVVVDACTGQTSVTTESWTVSLVGTSPDRLSRARVGGDRVLTNVVQYQISTPGGDVATGGIVREVIG